MKKWEDIVRERLEGYESTLPEGSYADFQRLRADAKAAPRKKVYPLAWVAAAAVAASLAAVLFLRQPAQPEGGVQLVERQADKADSGVQLVERQTIQAEEGVQLIEQQADGAVPMEVPGADSQTDRQSTSSLLAQAAASSPDKPVQQSASEKNKEEVQESDIEVNPEEYKEDPVTVLREEPFIPTGSPFIPEKRSARKVNLKVAVPVAGGVLGTSALGLLAVNFARGTAADMASYPIANPVGGNVPDMDDPPILALPNPSEEGKEQEKLLETRHTFPLRLGVSARIPVWNRLYLITGLEYSRYSSQLTYLLAGERRQVAQYLGIPLRLDWVFPLGKRFDAYAGAGMQADFCLAATRDGYSVRRDAPSLSLGAAGGVQLNLARHVGLYVEPQLSWRVPMGGHTLQTYKTQHPWMFSLSAGVRINIE